MANDPLKALIHANLAPSSPREQAQVEALILVAERSRKTSLEQLLELSCRNSDLYYFSHRLRNTQKLFLSDARNRLFTARRNGGPSASRDGESAKERGGHAQGNETNGQPGAGDLFGAQHLTARQLTLLARAAFEDSGLTMRALAQQVGVTSATVSRALNPKMCKSNGEPVSMRLTVDIIHALTSFQVQRQVYEVEEGARLTDAEHTLNGEHALNGKPAHDGKFVRNGDPVRNGDHLQINGVARA